jgi:hypothetical protein
MVLGGLQNGQAGWGMIVIVSSNTTKTHASMLAEMLHQQ